MGDVIADAQLGIAHQSCPHLVALRRVQQVGSQIFRADGVGLGLLEVLALVVARGRHREAEADQQAEQGQRGGEDEPEVLALLRGELPSAPVTGAEPGGQPQPDEGEEEDDRWMQADIAGLHGHPGSTRFIHCAVDRASWPSLAASLAITRWRSSSSRFWLSLSLVSTRSSFMRKATMCLVCSAALPGGRRPSPQASAPLPS